MKIFDRIADDRYEEGVVCHDAAIGLRAIDVVHSTASGLALGGGSSVTTTEAAHRLARRRIDEVGGVRTLCGTRA